MERKRTCEKPHIRPQNRRKPKPRLHDRVASFHILTEEQENETQFIDLQIFIRHLSAFQHFILWRKLWPQQTNFSEPKMKYFISVSKQRLTTDGHSNQQQSRNPFLYISWLLNGYKNNETNGINDVLSNGWHKSTEPTVDS